MSDRGSDRSEDNSMSDPVDEHRDSVIAGSGDGAGEGAASTDYDESHNRSETHPQVEAVPADAQHYLSTIATGDDEVRTILSELKKLAETKRTLVVLLIGKTGMGKSSLFYAIFGRNDKIPLVTERVTGDSVDLGGAGFDGVTVTFIDTPGLDKVSGAEGKKYYTEVKQHVRNADLILFCYQVTQRVHYEDLKVMKFLKQKFGDGFLAKTVMILTFANCIIAPRDHSVEDEKEKIISNTSSKLREQMIEAEFDVKIVEGVKFVEADNPYEADEWLPQFLASCLTMGISENTKAALLQTTYKMWAEKARFDGTTHTLTLSTGITLIAIGLPALIAAPPLGATLITSGGIAIAVHNARRKKECRRNLEYQQRLKSMQKQGGI